MDGDKEYAPGLSNIQQGEQLGPYLLLYSIVLFSHVPVLYLESTTWVGPFPSLPWFWMRIGGCDIPSPGYPTRGSLAFGHVSYSSLALKQYRVGCDSEG
jgi:hypothetical protein